MSTPPNTLDGKRPVSLANLHIEHERLMDCIHCGLCLSSCPTYSENGIEADSPRGRIYLMRGLYEGRLEPTPDVVDHLDLCLGCRACETACPSGVQYGALIEGTRAHLRETGTKKSLKDRLILKGAEMSFPYPNRLALMLVPIRILRQTGILPLMRRLGIMRLFGYLGDLEMLLPPLPAMARRRAFPSLWRAKGRKESQVALLTGCVMQVMQTQVNEATARVLTAVGCDVGAPKDQVCCGAMHAHTGAIGVAKDFARKNIEVFEAWEAKNGPLEALVVNAAGCGSALKEYPIWFHEDPLWAERAERLASKVKDISEFLVQPQYLARLEEDLGATTSHTPGPTEDSVVTYHDACHLSHGQGIRLPPRQLLNLLPGLKVVPLFESETCCGSAGTYNITQPAMALDLLQRKMKNVEKTGASVCVTGNPGCAMQLMLGAGKFGPPVTIKHPIELIDAALTPAGAAPELPRHGTSA